MNENYNYIDYAEFLVFPNYLRIGKERSAEGWLERQLSLLAPYSKYIPLYHSVKCEHLEFFYLCFKSVCAVDEKLFQDFIQDGWRGTVWAAWISCITPYPDLYMTKLLKKINPADIPHNYWLVEIALNILAEGHKNKGIHKSMEQFRDYISMIPRIKVPLRPWYSSEYIRQRSEFQYKLKNIYKSKGTEAAFEFFRSNKNSTYDVDYKTWVRNLSKITS